MTDLTIGMLESILANYTCDRFTVGDAEYSKSGMLREITQKLLATMQENERLRNVLKLVSGRCVPEVQIVVNQALSHEVSDAG